MTEMERIRALVLDIERRGEEVTAEVVLKLAYGTGALHKYDPGRVREAHRRLAQRAIAGMTDGQMRLFLSPAGSSGQYVRREQFLTPGALRQRKLMSAARHFVSELDQLEPGPGDGPIFYAWRALSALTRPAKRKAA